MEKLLLLILLPSVAFSAKIMPKKMMPKNAQDPEKCIDISKYSDVLYNQTTFSLGSIVCRHVCKKSIKEVCLDVESIDCEILGYSDCASELIAEGEYDADQTVIKQYVPKICTQVGTQVNWNILIYYSTSSVGQYLKT